MKTTVNPSQVLEMARHYERVPNNTGVLAPFAETIRIMREEKRAPYREITRFLNDAGVNVSYQGVYLFSKKNKIGDAGHIRPPRNPAGKNGNRKIAVKKAAATKAEKKAVTS